MSAPLLLVVRARETLACGAHSRVTQHCNAFKSLVK